MIGPTCIHIHTHTCIHILFACMDTCMQSRIHTYLLTTLSQTLRLEGILVSGNRSFATSAIATCIFLHVPVSTPASRYHLFPPWFSYSIPGSALHMASVACVELMNHGYMSSLFLNPIYVMGPLSP